MLGRIGRETRRAAVLVAGSALLAMGLALIPLPGPGLLVMLLGLGVLAAEFAWARRTLDQVKSWTSTHLEGTAIGRWVDRHDPISLGGRTPSHHDEPRRSGSTAA